jgi:hypothetical protein
MMELGSVDIASTRTRKRVRSWIRECNDTGTGRARRANVMNRASFHVKAGIPAIYF